MEPWRSAITAVDDGQIRIRGCDIKDLIRGATFADVVFLLWRERQPTGGERRLLDAILIACADHGPGAPSAAAARLVASGNRQSLEAAVAAGILAIGDAHGGAGQACMECLAEGIALARQEALSFPEAADRLVREARAAGERLPGLGHRRHGDDPRATVLFALAREEGIAGDGVAFLTALAEAVSRQIRPLPVNVDGAIAAILFDLGFPPPLAKGVFLLGRTAGLIAHVQEEYLREKPMRIGIPFVYDGVPSSPPRSAETSGKTVETPE